MAKKGQSRQRLREIYRSFKAARVEALAKQLAALHSPPGLSLPESQKNQWYYGNGFADGMKFFQSCAQNHPHRLPFLLGLKGGDNQC